MTFCLQYAQEPLELPGRLHFSGADQASARGKRDGGSGAHMALAMKGSRPILHLRRDKEAFPRSSQRLAIKREHVVGISAKEIDFFNVHFLSADCPKKQASKKRQSQQFIFSFKQVPNDYIPAAKMGLKNM